MKMKNENTSSKTMMTMARKADPSRMKMMAQSGSFRMSWFTEIPVAMMALDVVAKNGPVVEH